MLIVKENSQPALYSTTSLKIAIRIVDLLGFSVFSFIALVFYLPCISVRVSEKSSHKLQRGQWELDPDPLEGRAALNR